MIHPHDEQSLQAILQEQEIPKVVEDEYATRVGMYNRSGGSGPLGPLALVDMVRFLGLAPERPEEAPSRVDWRNYPQDGSVRVEARFFGDWQTGVFLGFVEAGILAVRLDADEMVRECRPDMVRLAKPGAEPVEEVPPRAEILEELSVDDEPQLPNFGAFEEGAALWVEVDGKSHDATFVSLGDDGVEVLLKGSDEPTVVEPDRVVPC